MSKFFFVFRWIMICILALSIPALLVMNGIQSRKYTDLERQITALEKKQADLIEQNKKLITDISLLSNTDRIEKLAKDNLNMRPAETDEIVRVEMKDSSK